MYVYTWSELTVNLIPNLHAALFYGVPFVKTPCKNCMFNTHENVHENRKSTSMCRPPDLLNLVSRFTKAASHFIIGLMHAETGLVKHEADLVNARPI